MSYILDALKKSSEERQKLQKIEQQPGSVSLTMSTDRKKPRHFTLSLLFLVIAGSAVLGGSIWYYFKELSPQSAVTQTTEPVHEQPAVITDTPAEQNAPAEPEVAEVQQAKNGDASRIGKTENPQDRSSSDKALSSPPLQAELPSAVQQSLPELKYSGHVYSPTPPLRMIMINTAIIREGDIIAPDLSMVEITEDGLIMNYQGTLFKVLLF